VAVLAGFDNAVVIENKQQWEEKWRSKILPSCRNTSLRQVTRTSCLPSAIAAQSSGLMILMHVFLQSIEEV